MASDTHKVQEIRDKFTRLNITPVEFNNLAGEPFILMNAFRLIFLDLIRRDIISIDPIAVYIHTDKISLLKDYEREFIKILLANMPVDTSGEDFENLKSISLSLFFNFLNLNIVRINESMKKIKVMLAQTYWQNQSLKKEAIILKGYLKQQKGRYPDSTYGVFLLYQRTRSIDLMALYSLAAFNPKTYQKIDLQEASNVQIHSVDQEAFCRNIARALDTYAARYVGIK